MLPRLVVRVRRTVRRLQAKPAHEDLSGVQNLESWRVMLSEIDARGRALEWRLAEAERALNRLGRE